MANKVSIGFTGDFSFSGYFSGLYNKENLIDDKILDFLENNDANILNFESPITSCRVTKKKRLAHRSDPEALSFVKKHIKNPVLSLANNHMMDYSFIGMTDTLENVKNEGIAFIGAGKDVDEAAKYLVFGNEELKIGVFAIQYKNFKVATEKRGGPLHDRQKEVIKKRISEMKGKVDYVVLVYHGGDEFLHAPMPYFRKHLKNYLDMGCDVVVAHHPHVVQGYESFGNKKIFYSLGNFMFDTAYQRMQEDSDRGILLKLIFSKDKVDFEHMPIRIDREEVRVISEMSDEYFKDIKNNYSRLWAVEAARKKGIDEKAKILRKKETKETLKEKSKLKKDALDLRKKYETLDDQIDEEEEEFLEDLSEERIEELVEEMLEENKKDISISQKIKSLIKKVLKKDSYNRLIVKYGSFKAKYIYRQ